MRWGREGRKGEGLGSVRQVVQVPFLHIFGFGLWCWVGGVVRGSDGHNG